MATIFNANTTEGLVITPDTSGEMVFQSNGTQVLKVTGATGSFDVPVGTTAERPTSPTTGTIRYNTTEGALETYDGSAWTSVGASTWTTTGSNIYYTTGNVGIGTSSPATALDITTSGGGKFQVTDWGASSQIGVDAANKALRINGTTSVRIHTGTAGSQVESLRVDDSSNLKFNSGYGSVATAYGCRKWVVFQGTGTVTVIASGGVSSVTDNFQGVYTINFNGALPNTSYAVTGTAVGNFQSTNGTNGRCGTVAPNLNGTYSTTAVQVLTKDSADQNFDSSKIGVAIFR